MAGNGMEVDPPTSIASGSTITNTPGLLKRSNSAPMINILTSGNDESSNSSVTSQTSPASSTASIPAGPSTSANPTTHRGSLTPQPSKPSEVSRIRRFSASHSSGLHSPTGKIPNRLDQLKHEETFQKDREIVHEREIQSAATLAQSWEDLSLSEEPMVMDVKRPKSFNEPLHIFTSPVVYSGSPSPTRLAKQCFSPSLQAPVRNNTLTPSPSPSPTRKSFVRRSLSPITMRPSPLSSGGIKRKQVDIDDMDRPESYFSPPKRFHTGSSSPIRMATQNPLIHHLSSTASSPSSSLGSPDIIVPNTSCSPLVLQAHQPMHISNHPLVPTVSSSVVNVSSSSSLTCVSTTTTSPASCFTFRPVRDSIDMQATDSDQASDMTETTDISEQSDIPLNNIDPSPNSSFGSMKSTPTL